MMLQRCKLRSGRLITLCCVLLSLTPADVASQSVSFRIAAVTSATAPAAVLASPPDGDAERPNPVRRFFSWIIQGVTRPFRRRPQVACSLPPMAAISPSNSSITLPCPRTTTATLSANCPSVSQLELAASVTDPEGQPFLYAWSVTAGRILGEGRKVTWDLTGVPLGTYTATVEVSDGHQHTAVAATAVAVSRCADCESPPPICPSLSVSCPSELEPNKPIVFEANVTGGEPGAKANITWTLTSGKIISGQGTSKITVSASEAERRRSLTATASLEAADPSCSGTASCSINIDEAADDRNPR
jgi:hypothetical protein